MSRMLNKRVYIIVASILVYYSTIKRFSNDFYEKIKTLNCCCNASQQCLEDRINLQYVK